MNGIKYNATMQYLIDITRAYTSMLEKYPALKKQDSGKLYPVFLKLAHEFGNCSNERTGDVYKNNIYNFTKGRIFKETGIATWDNLCERIINSDVERSTAKLALDMVHDYIELNELDATDPIGNPLAFREDVMEMIRRVNDAGTLFAFTWFTVISITESLVNALSFVVGLMNEIGQTENIDSKENKSTRRMYIAKMADGEDDLYDEFFDDQEAIIAFLEEGGEDVLEIYECNDDEFFTPNRCVWH